MRTIYLYSYLRPYQHSIGVGKYCGYFKMDPRPWNTGCRESSTSLHYISSNSTADINQSTKSQKLVGLSESSSLYPTSRLDNRVIQYGQLPLYSKDPSNNYNNDAQCNQSKSFAALGYPVPANVVRSDYIPYPLKLSGETKKDILKLDRLDYWNCTIGCGNIPILAAKEINRAPSYPSNRCHIMSVPGRSREIATQSSEITMGMEPRFPYTYSTQPLIYDDIYSHIRMNLTERFVPNYQNNAYCQNGDVTDSIMQNIMVSHFTSLDENSRMSSTHSTRMPIPFSPQWIS